MSRWWRSTPQSVRGTTSVLIFTRPRRHGFARTTAVLDQLGLTIVDARITPTAMASRWTLYHLLEDDGAPISDHDRLRGDRAWALRRSRRDRSPACRVAARARQLRVFNTPTQITISVDERNHRSVLELTAGDRPGLLCDVGKVLWEERIELQGARISTLGERAEDVFYITDRAQEPLAESAAERLRMRLAETLSPAPR
jgi:[protein-PII] uridylyltransferase